MQRNQVYLFDNLRSHATLASSSGWMSMHHPSIKSLVVWEYLQIRGAHTIQRLLIYPNYQIHFPFFSTSHFIIEGKISRSIVPRHWREDPRLRCESEMYSRRNQEKGGVEGKGAGGGGSRCLPSNLDKRKYIQAGNSFSLPSLF